MPTKRELYADAVKYGIKGRSRMTKNELEDAILLYDAINWFNDIAGNKITILEDSNKITILEDDSNQSIEIINMDEPMPDVSDD